MSPRSVDADLEKGLTSKDSVDSSAKCSPKRVSFTDNASPRSSRLSHLNSVWVGVWVAATILSSARSITLSILQDRSQVRRFCAYPSVRVFLALTTLVAVPFIVWDAYLDPSLAWQRIVITWDALLHSSIWPIVATALVAGVLLRESTRATYHKVACAIVLFFSVAVIVASQLQVVLPSWFWNPFMWGQFQIYRPRDIQHHLQGVCVDSNRSPQHQHNMPLCLNENSWKALSSGVLSSHNANDVSTVLKGLEYVQKESGGLIINVMSRDTVGSIPALRQNVEGLVPFFPDGKLSVVVFENDSKDGSRDAFKEWGKQAKGYSVDVMSCGPDNPDCQFGMSHRYDATEAKDYFRSSAIGKMADFRQRIVDYVTGSEQYAKFSHMIVLDLDLAVSLSPLGVLHTLGLGPIATEHAVASSGRQVWPGSMGTFTPPYDFSAFRAIETPANKRLHDLQRAFCGLLPAGDRWRNQCDAASSMHLYLVLSHDWLSNGEPYPVTSAFNGATMYPLQLVKETKAMYDVGDDGQRCEHIGFNLSLKKPMYVNPRWNMHVEPTNPGGPTGLRAFKNVIRIVFQPRLALTVFFQNVIFMFAFVYSVLALGTYVLHPVLCGAVGYVRARTSKDEDVITTSNPAPLPETIAFRNSDALKRRVA